MKILTISTSIDFPGAAQATKIRRRRHRLDQPKRFTTETVYAITNRCVHQAKPAQLAAWIRRHRLIQNHIHWSATSPTTRIDPKIRTGTGPHVMTALRNAIGALRVADVTNTAAANRVHACASNRPLALLAIT